MKAPLILDESDEKWQLAKLLIGSLDTRRTRQELAKQDITPVGKAVNYLKTSMLSMLMSLEVSYTVSELKKRKKLRKYLEIDEVPSDKQVSEFLSRYKPEKFVKFVEYSLNNKCKSRKGRGRILIDSTDIQVDLNWFKQNWSKEDLKDKEFGWGYSPTHDYYIGYKLTFAIEKCSGKPLGFILREGSPSDAKMFKHMLEKLKSSRKLKTGDIVIADKGYFPYRNYKIGIAKYRIIPVIYPKTNIEIQSILSKISYPLKVFISKAKEKLKETFRELYQCFKALMPEWKSLKSERSWIEDVFKNIKNCSPYPKIHRYTKASVTKFLSIAVLLVGTAIAYGNNSKEDLQRLAEW